VQSIIVWDFQANAPVNRLQRFHGFHTNIIRDVKWIAESQFASCSDDETIQLYQIGTASPIKALNLKVIKKYTII
jgi:WD40 repeat protein